MGPESDEDPSKQILKTLDMGDFIILKTETSKFHDFGIIEPL